MQTFQTHYENHKKSPEINSGEIMVETQGYVPSQKRIESIINAGKRLIESRSEMYDFPDGNDDGSFDPSRSKNFDLSDATELQHQLDARFAETKRKAVSEAALKASEAKKSAKPVKDIPEKEITSDDV